MQDKEQVFIGVLSNGMMQHATHSLLAFHLGIWSYDPKVPFAFAYWVEAGSSPQDYKRNTIIQKFLESGCDTLMMIDDDMILSASVLDLLKTPDYDIAGPIQYSMKAADPEKNRETPECFPCAFMRDTERGGQMLPVWPKGDGSVSEVDIVGSGVIAIKRRVLEDQKLLHAPDLDPPAFFRNIWEPNGRRSCGLDVDFCIRAKELGYRILVNWGVQVGHFKRVNLNDVDLFAKSQFKLGYEVGSKHAVQMDREEGRPREGADRGAPGPQRDATVA